LYGILREADVRHEIAMLLGGWGRRLSGKVGASVSR